MGLNDSQHISTILVHPNDSKTVFAAVQDWALVDASLVAFGARVRLTNNNGWTSDGGGPGKMCSVQVFGTSHRRW